MRLAIYTFLNNGARQNRNPFSSAFGLQAKNWEFLIRVSSLELRPERIGDLLENTNSSKSCGEGQAKLGADGCTEVIVTSAERTLQCLTEGEKDREANNNGINEKSSPSHFVFRIIIESSEQSSGVNGGRDVRVSQLNFVSLTGSERKRLQTATERVDNNDSSFAARETIIRELCSGAQDGVNGG